MLPDCRIILELLLLTGTNLGLRSKGEVIKGFIFGSSQTKDWYDFGQIARLQ